MKIYKIANVPKLKKRPKSHVGKIEPAQVGKGWKKHKKLDTRLLPVHRYTLEEAEFPIVIKS